MQTQSRSGGWVLAVALAMTFVAFSIGYSIVTGSVANLAYAPVLFVLFAVGPFFALLSAWWVGLAIVLMVLTTMAIAFSGINTILRLAGVAGIFALWGYFGAWGVVGFTGGA